MAGIGFELKSLFKGKGLINYSKACTFSILITVGPTLLCILMMVILLQLMFIWDLPLVHRELFMASVMYSFIFSMMLTGGFSMILSRYVSDKIYKKETKDILPSLKGAIIIIVIMSGLLGILFYSISPLQISFKFAAYILFMELNILWLLMVYISALKDYIKIAKGFFAGIASIFFILYFIKLLNKLSLTGIMFSMDIGFLVIALFLYGNIKTYFINEDGDYFAFLSYLDEHRQLYFIGFFYSLGLYLHNILFWFSGKGVIIGHTYIISPTYDVPAFWAFLTIIPSIIIFTVSCEISIYEKYRVYYNTICNEGVFLSILKKQNELRMAISRGIKKVMEIQLIFSVSCLFIGINILPLIKPLYITVGIFSMMIIGYYSFILMFVFLTVLLYFDDKYGALFLTLFFVFSNALLTQGTIWAGEKYYGLGYAVSAVLSLIIGFIRLNHILDNLSYYTFCSQPVMKSPKQRLFTRFSTKAHDFFIDTN